MGSQDLQTTAEALAAATIATAANNQSVITDEFVSLEEAVNSALGGLGADVRALELQTDFLNDISDATEEGLGNIVDADMADPFVEAIGLKTIPAKRLRAALQSTSSFRNAAAEISAAVEVRAAEETLRRAPQALPAPKWAAEEESGGLAA